MADDNKVSFILDLDLKEFTEQGLKAKGVIEKLGAEENVSGLVEGLLKVGPIIGAAAAAAYTFKKAIDLTVEGEEIERINSQFETLATQAGIAPKELQEGLEKAGKGLIDTTDALKIANEAIIKMGGSAEKLPEIMEIARKSVSVYGGDVKSNFSAISEAIANGNVRALKHYGITVDMAKAERDFAEANGVAVNSLSEAGKKQAILNAALESGSNAYKNINENTESATMILQNLKVTFNDIGEAFILIIEKTIGPSIRSFLKGVQGMANEVKSIADSLLAYVKGADDSATNRRLANIKKVSDASIADKDKQIKQEALFNNELNKLDKAHFDQQQKNITSLDQIDALSKKRKQQLEAQHLQALNALKANSDLTDKQKIKLKEVEDQRFHDQLRNNERETDAFRKKLLDQYVQNSESASQGISRAFIANSQKMKMEQADFGKRGEQMWNSLSINSQAAFTQMGAQMAQGKDAGQAAADAMKGFFLGMLGDRAIAEGSLLLLSSIWPPNPLGLAAGAGLLALGGALKSASGLGGSGLSPSAQATATGTAPKMEGDIQKQQLQTRIDIAGQKGDSAEEAKLKRELLENERLQAQQDILERKQKKDLNEDEANRLIRQNDELYNLKKQQLENDLNQESMRASKSSSSSSFSSDEAMPNMAAQQRAQKTVSVNIAGNYLETDQTKRMLMDLMRQESDATGFNYNQIGA